MKKVVDYATVAHLWANQRQDEARTSSGNFYFDNLTIYSYGRHFPIATISKNDSNVVFFTTQGYSNTTARHIRLAAQACSHKEIILCDNPENANRGSHTLNLESFERRIKSHLQGLLRCRKPEKYIEPAKNVYAECKKYCEAVGIDIPENITNLIAKSNTEDYVKYLEAEHQKYLEALEKQKVREAKAYKEDLKKWKAFKIHNLWRASNIEFRFDGKEVETSKGVKMSKQVALRIYDKFKKNKYKIGDKVLDYEISEITNEKFVIGCHEVLFKTCDKFIKQLK
jgi:hypothetical protein